MKLTPSPLTPPSFPSLSAPSPLTSTSSFLGKTSFLSNVIYRLLHLPPPLLASEQSPRSLDNGLSRFTGPERVILVSAPTNKAVMVLASRVLSLLDSPKKIPPVASELPLLSPSWGALRRGVNVALVGVEDKVVDVGTDVGGVFVWSYIEFLADRVDDLIKLSDRLISNKLVYVSLKQAISDSSTSQEGAPLGDKSLAGAAFQLGKYVAELDKFLKLEIPRSYYSPNSEIDKRFEAVYNEDSSTLLSSLESLREAICTRLQRTAVAGEKISTASLIFSTLASSGSSIVRRNLRIHTLIVDEAAASVEAEFLVPLLLYPRRILLVGDPGQLPAMVCSRFNKSRLDGRGEDSVRTGAFEESIMERMIALGKAGGGYEHSMLDLQYRMDPEIR